MSHTMNPDILTAPKPARQSWLRTRLGMILSLFVITLLVGAVAMFYRMNYVPSDLDTSTTLTSAQGLFQIGYVAEVEPVPINQMHSWTLRVVDSQGRPVERAAIRVDGDMPQHGHGLPTRPQVTEYLGDGEYRVEGLKFHMPGWWVVDFSIEHAGQRDEVRFNLLLK